MATESEKVMQVEDDVPMEEHTVNKEQGLHKMFTLKKWNAVAMWSWDVECDTCAICRVQVMGKTRQLLSLTFHIFEVVKNTTPTYYDVNAVTYVFKFLCLTKDACLRCQSDNKQEECVGKYGLLFVFQLGATLGNIYEPHPFSERTKAWHRILSGLVMSVTWELCGSR